MRIGDIIRSQGHATEDEVDAALRRQVVHGGRFGTCLVEIRSLDLDLLAEALATQHEIPAATAQHFGRADAAVMRRLDPEVAARLRVIPLGMLSREPPRVAIASTDPLSEDAVAELSAIFEAEVVGAIAPELRVYYYLEIVYGIERLPRFRRARTTDRRPSTSNGPGAERRRYLRMLTEDEGAQPVTQLAKIAVRRVAVSPARPREIVVGEAAEPRLDTVGGGVSAIRRGMSRDRIGSVVVGTLENAFNETLRVGIIFAARDAVLIGWKGFVREGGRPDAIETMALETGAASMLRDPFESAVPYFGEPPALEVDAHFYRALGLSAPHEVAVIPVVLRSEVVCLIYADSMTPMDAATVGGLAELGQGLAAAFDRLVKAAER